MGYTEAQARSALTSTGGDLVAALQQLLDPPEGSAPPAPVGVLPAAVAGEGADVASDCAICQEPLHLSDAAMRCAGRGGSHHYCHAACLARWVKRCRDNASEPTCPTCRGPLQLHRHHLQTFLQQAELSAGGATQSLSAQDRRILQRMLEQDERLAEGRGNSGRDDGWSEINFDKLATAALMGVAAVGTAVAATVLLKHVVGGSSGRSRRR